jgi:hypothetical protein
MFCFSTKNKRVILTPNKFYKTVSPFTPTSVKGSLITQVRREEEKIKKRAIPSQEVVKRAAISSRGKLEKHREKFSLLWLFKKTKCRSFT